jgi:nitrogen fixation/metabolism regulation signal transduction histidine kinase
MDEADAMIAVLDSPDWTSVLDGVAAAATWLSSLMPGDHRGAIVTRKLLALAMHPKWEVRRSVANAAAKMRNDDFDSTLARLAADDNARVRRAAEVAILRRRDWGQASALGKQHEQHLHATLDDIDARFGPRGRAAVKRAAEHVANTFTRELYHEVVRLLSPLATSADRLLMRLDSERASAALVEEASRMKERVARLRTFLDAMRTYAAQPRLEFASEDLSEVVEESVAIVRDERKSAPEIIVNVEPGIQAVMCRSRLVQALTNLLVNAVEAYHGDAANQPISIGATLEQERVVITVRDHGCGMSEEALADATVLFTTSKAGGTGFGLPLVVKIVESEHGGRLELRSRRGDGTTARLVIPARGP